MPSSPEHPGRSHLRLVESPEVARELPQEVRKAQAYAVELLQDEYGNTRSFAEANWTYMRSKPESNVMVRFQTTSNSYSLLYYKNGDADTATFEITLLRYRDIPRDERPARPSVDMDWCIGYGEPELDTIVNYSFELEQFPDELERHWGPLPEAVRRQYGIS